MMRWSADLKYGFLCKDNLLYLQSALRNMICADELKNIVYKDLTEAARKTMRKIVDHLKSVENPPETIQQKLLGLRWNCAWSAANSKYGYLKKPLKDMVDSIVDTFQKESSFCLRFTKTFRQKIAAFGENGAYLFPAYLRRKRLGVSSACLRKKRAK